jgi:hypothetical protein
MQSQEATNMSSNSKKRKLEDISPSEDGVDLDARKSFKRLKLSQEEDYAEDYKPSKTHATENIVTDAAAAVEEQVPMTGDAQAQVVTETLEEGILPKVEGLEPHQAFEISHFDIYL